MINWITGHVTTGRENRPKKTASMGVMPHGCLMRKQRDVGGAAE